jgi:hypothetical protein
VVDGNTELGGHHAGCLVHDVVEARTGLQLCRELPGRCLGLEEEDQFSRDVGEPERIRMSLTGERTRSISATSCGCGGCWARRESLVLG